MFFNGSIYTKKVISTDRWVGEGNHIVALVKKESFLLRVSH